MNRILFSLLCLSTFPGCQSPINDIQNQYTISGRIHWPDQTPFEWNLTVYLLQDDQVVASTNTSQFKFEHLQEGANYSVLPVSTAEGRHGISSLDIVTIEHFIQGTQSLNLVQKIAADANKDHLINLEDVEVLRNCILSSPKTDQCPTYRFVSEAHDDTSFNYVDQYNTGKLFGNHIVAFLPIKIGDLNNTIIIN